MNLSIRFLFSFRRGVSRGSVRFRNVICSGRITGFMGSRCGFCCFVVIRGRILSLYFIHLTFAPFLVSLSFVAVGDLVSVSYDSVRSSIKSRINNLWRIFHSLLIRSNKSNIPFAFISRISSCWLKVNYSFI